MSIYKEIVFVLRYLFYLHLLFPGCWIKDPLHRNAVSAAARKFCFRSNFFPSFTFFLSCLGLSLKQVGTKPASCLLDVFISSTAAVRAVKWSSILNFSQCPQRLLKLTALEKAFKDPGSPEDT